MIRDTLADALVEALAAEQLEVESVHLERPARREHGDWSSNVAMVAAGDAGRPPRELATALAERLDHRGGVLAATGRRHLRGWEPMNRRL